MTPEAIELLARLVYKGGGSISGYGAAASWLADQGYIEAWRAGHWTVTDRGVSALIAARNKQEGTK